MNRQNFEIPGGFPLEADTLGEMQKAYRLLNALGEIAGDKAIVQGCVEDGEHISDGVVYVDGEVFVFRGGKKQDTVIVKEDAVTKTFESSQKHEVLFKRYVTFGSGEGSMNWRQFKRYRLVEEVAEFKDEVTDKLAGKAPLLHTHDDRYYTETEIDTAHYTKVKIDELLSGVSQKKGPKGDTGPQGPRGYTGSQGPKGDTGPRGSDASVRDYGLLVNKKYEVVRPGGAAYGDGENMFCCSVSMEYDRYSNHDGYGIYRHITPMYIEEAEEGGGGSSSSGGGKADSNTPVLLKLGFAKIKITQ
ncbi:MAG: hypothetical protein V6Z82_04705 [Flavobacteriales bacterium]